MAPEDELSRFFAVSLDLLCIAGFDGYFKRLNPAWTTGLGWTLEEFLAVLSDRELQVFRLIGEGRGTRQIAEALHLSIKTIESHREHLKHKLKLESSAELAQRASQWVETGRTA